MIEVEKLCKTYKVLEGRKGLAGAVRNLFSRRYRLIEAVRSVSFRVAAGEAVGLIGPNGAGKSTMIKILAGILVPTSGRALVRGIEPYRARQENARRIAVVFGQRTKLWWDLPCMESFELHRSMYRIPGPVYRRNLEEFTELLELSEFWKMPVRQLSLGQRMRAEIAVSLLHDPEVIYLDEPTIGMDAVAKDRIRRFLAEANRTRRTTLFVTSHDMADIEKLCPRVVLIDKGAIVYDGLLEGIRRAHGLECTLVVELSREAGVIQPPFGRVVKDEGLKKTISFSRADGSVVDLLTWLGSRCELADIRILEPEIEAIIREVYEHGLDARAGSNPA
jgi:ABC-2 type transport system ATP-binding protein